MNHRAQNEKTNITVSKGKGKSKPRRRFTVRSMCGEKGPKVGGGCVYINSFCNSMCYFSEQGPAS